MASVIDLTDLPRFERIEIYEDNAGGLWFRPVGQGIVIEMPSNGVALADCRLYGTDWHAGDSPESVYPESAVMLDKARHVASWDAKSDAITLEAVPELLGREAHAYLLEAITAVEDERTAKIRDRIDRAVERAQTFANTQDENDDDTRLVDMLTDLRHWAEKHGADWAYGIRMSEAHWEAERNGYDL